MIERDGEPPPEQRHIAPPSKRLATVAGHGDPVVLVHGLSGSNAMYEIDFQSLSGFLSSFLRLSGGALRLDQDAFVAVVEERGGTLIAFIIVLIAGLSHMLGQSVGLLPYLGNAIDKALRLWVLLALIVALHAAYGAGFWSALGCAVAGWAVALLILRTPIPSRLGLRSLPGALRSGTHRPPPYHEPSVVTERIPDDPGAPASKNRRG